MAQKKAHSLGEVVEVPEGGVVRRPDGSEQKVTGGLYVLDEVGTFVIDGAEVTAK